MTITTNTNTYRKIRNAFVDCLALTGWLVLAVILATALFPEFSRQVEQYGVYLLDEVETFLIAILS